MALQRLIALTVPLLLVSSATLTVVLGPQWAPPVGVGAVVFGDSMEPNICAGDLIIYQDGTRIDEGDVITFHTKTGPLPVTTHRVVAVTDDGYLTRGDNEPRSDYALVGYVNDAQVIGEVLAVVSIRSCDDPHGGRPLAARQPKSDRQSVLPRGS